jgi:hypothetical protein
MYTIFKNLKMANMTILGTTDVPVNPKMKSKNPLKALSLTAHESYNRIHTP